MHRPYARKCRRGTGGLLLRDDLRGLRDDLRSLRDEGTETCVDIQPPPSLLAQPSWRSGGKGDERDGVSLSLGDGSENHWGIFPFVARCVGILL